VTLSAPDPHDTECLVREVLTGIWDKWTPQVVWRLGDGTLRFSELRKVVEGISERMLTVTLRRLERDGLVERTVFAEVPPRVDYQLTEMGLSLLSAVSSLFRWTDEHISIITDARTNYDSGVQEIPWVTRKTVLNESRYGLKEL
jgi:DNA-binding HxlR family transcriptional regulator